MLVIGAAGIRVVGAHNLGLVGAGLAAVALGVAELATLRIAADRPAPAPAAVGAAQR